MVTRKEHNVCLALQQWFNSYNINCWHNNGEIKFTTKLSQKKPDLIIFSKNENGFIAIEVKNGDISKDLYDASKIIEYWEEYTLNKIEYYIDGIKINIKSFAVATLYSQFGRLFKEDNEIINIEDCKDDKWKTYCKINGIEPKYEFRRTHDYLRNLWSQWRKKRGKNQAGIGIMLSDVLNSKEIIESIGSPLLFDMQYEMQIKPKWQNRQRSL